MRSPYDASEIRQNENEPDTIRGIMMEKYERCTFCNSRLVFSHDLNIQYLQVIETSRCPGCGVTTNPKKFTLQ